MAWVELDLQSDIAEFEKQYDYDGMMWYADNSYNADGTLWSTVQQAKVNKADITYAAFNTTEFPLMSRRKGVLQKTSGFTTAQHDFREATNGKWYALKLEDRTLPEIVIKDHEDNVVQTIPALTIPFGTTFYNNCTYNTVTTEPDWVVVE